MNRVFLEQHLAMAERHATQGEQHILRQREIVAKLEADNNAALLIQARALLAQFEDLQTLHVADRDRLRKELGLD
jgi:hypothetical protein